MATLLSEEPNLQAEHKFRLPHLMALHSLACGKAAPVPEGRQMCATITQHKVAQLPIILQQGTARSPHSKGKVL